jgi:CRISPR/Cas system CSM-associated protein Csm2 small subunit
MIDKELRKLNRLELLEMLVEQSKQIDELRMRLDIAEKKLADRDLKMKEAGSIAEAALKLNDVFEAADAAGKQYVDALKKLYDEEVNRSMKETVISDENR